MSTPNPFDADPAALAQLEGAYTAIRDQVLAAAKPVRHAITRGGAARACRELAGATYQSGAPYSAISQAYACALTEIARLQNLIDGVTVDDLPQWPTADDPREHARQRVTAFCDALMRLCVDHQLLPHVGVHAMPWLEDTAAEIEGTRIASDFHWCATHGMFAASEPASNADTAERIPWQVPDGHQ